MSRTLTLFHTTGSVSKRSYPKGRAFCKLTAPAQLLILHLCLSRPGIYLCDISDELLSVLEVDVNESAICKFLHKSGFTHQRLKVTAAQQDILLRQHFMAQVTVYLPEMLFFIDETGADNRNLVRRYGYSIRGKPLKTHSFFVRRERVSAIACISMAGLLDIKTLKGTSDGDIFYSFIHTFATSSHALQWHKPTLSCGDGQLQYPSHPRSREGNPRCGGTNTFFAPLFTSLCTYRRDIFKSQASNDTGKHKTS